jgi:hypothetical protein
MATRLTLGVRYIRGDFCTRRFQQCEVGYAGYEEKPRRIFEGNKLLGYRRDGVLWFILWSYPFDQLLGTIRAFVHPSVYVLQDVYPHLRPGERYRMF